MRFFKISGISFQQNLYFKSVLRDHCVFKGLCKTNMFCKYYYHNQQKHRTLLTSQMERFATIINGFKLLALAIAAKLSILDVCRGPDYNTGQLGVKISFVYTMFFVIRDYFWSVFSRIPTEYEHLWRFIQCAISFSRKPVYEKPSIKACPIIKSLSNIWNAVKILQKLKKYQIREPIINENMIVLMMIMMMTMMMNCFCGVVEQQNALTY